MGAQSIQFTLAAALLAAAASAPVAAQPFPSKPIKVLIPFVAGGPSDTVGRAIASKFQEYLGQPGVVENRPGANGAIAGEALAKADPDGYTVMVGSIGVFAINAALIRDLRYDPTRDFAPVTLAVTTPNVLIVKAGLPVSTAREYVDYARKNPGRISYASSGIGSSDHLTYELFKQMTKTFGVHIAYRGGAAAVSELIGGQVDSSFQNLGGVTGHIRAGRVKALAVTSAARSPQLPEVPTMAETGIGQLIVTSWQAMAAPGRTPREIVAKLNDAAVRALRAPDITQRLTATGYDVVAGTPEQFGEFMRAEVARWRDVVKRGNIQPE